MVTWLLTVVMVVGTWCRAYGFDTCVAPEPAEPFAMLIIIIIFAPNFFALVVSRVFPPCCLLPARVPDP